MAIYISGPNREPLSHDDVEYILKDRRPSTTIINPSKIFYLAEDAKRMQPSDVLKMRTMLAAECQEIVLTPGWERSYKSCCEIQSYLIAHEQELDVMVETITKNSKTGRIAIKRLIIGDDQEHIDALKETCRKRIRRHFKKL